MELLVYKASAGSGKTFTLAVEYIKHVILNPKAYRNILAVTFTNKATAEMKERILQQLYGIWISDTASEPYLNRIREDLKNEELSDTDIRKAAGTALQYMLHDYSFFRVETIDSFFQSVMRNLARELELSPNMNIELNNTDVLSDAVDSLIDNLTPSSPVLEWLLDYIKESIDNDKRWNVSNEIKKFGKNIFDEYYLERGEGLRNQLKQPDTIKLYRKTLREMETEALKQMENFYIQFIEKLEENDLDVDDLKSKQKGIGSYFKKLKEGKLSDKEVLNSTLYNSLNDANNWTTKTSSRKDDIIRLAESELIPLLQDAETYRPKNNKIVNSCRLSLKHLNNLQLLSSIDEEVRYLNQKHNRFLLSDTNALLHNLIREGDSSFVFEKIGANIRNVMIDEFQDTSRMQWDNFKILLLEGLSQGADSLIVGDVKQSIYRWRSGDWEILNSLGNAQAKSGNSALGNFPVRVETLNTNRRSESRIIKFNNALFSSAVEYLNKLHLQELKEDCLPLIRAYADVEQQSPRKEDKGYVKVAFLEDDEEYSYADNTLIALGEEVQQLLEAGVKLNDIAILVRTNKHILPIADYFDKTMKLPIVSDEAFRLSSSQALCMLMDALRYLSNPNDGIARASLVTYYKTLLYNSNDNENKIDWDETLTAKPEQILPHEFISRLDTLRLMPLYELFEEIIHIFGINNIANQEAYLFFFFDAATDYLQNNSPDLGAFIRFWDTTLCSKTIPSGEIDGIRILSIHKSKGLEFHTVLIPFCDWMMENERNNQLIWCSSDEPPFCSLDIVPINYSAKMAESVYRDDYLHERLQMWVDNLNLLYVAFTRAGKNLILWSKKGLKRSMSELLANALPKVAIGDGNESWDEEMPYEIGEICQSATSDKQASYQDDSFNRLSQKASKLPVKMESMRHDIEFRQSNQSADFISGVDEEESNNRFINRGRLLHTLFSAIETTEDIENAVNQLLFKGVISKTETVDEIMKLTRRAFSVPQVQNWYSGQWQLFNECTIIWQEDGELHTRRPDRVMMRDDEIVVVDFKFGKQNKKYNKQVKEYVQLLVDMGYPKENIKGYLWYVEDNCIENVTN